MRFKALLLDLDDTLYDSTSIYKTGLRRAHEHFAAHPLSEQKNELKSFDSFERAYLNARKSVKSLLPNVASSHSRLLYFKRLLELELGKTFTQLSLELDRAYSSAWQQIDFSGSLKMLRSVKERKIQSCIITNHICQTQLEKLDYLDPTAQLIDFVLVSEELGCQKPDRRVFDEALRRLGVRAEQAVMVGDSWEADVLGALGAGICAIHLGPNGGPNPIELDKKNESKYLGRIVKITDLTQIIDEWM